MGAIGKKSILKNYLLAYVGVAVAACAVLGLVLLNVSSRYMDQQERDAIQQRLISASDDFCYQMEQMEQLSIRLRTKERYQPFYLAKNAYNELEMIKDFAQYSGLVPIAGAYYLAYEDTAVVFSADAKIEYPLFTRQYADNTPYEDFIAAMHDGACFWRIETADKPIIFYKRPIYFNRYSQNSQADLLLAMNQAAMQERYASLFKLDEGLSIDVDGVTLLGEGTEQAAMAHSRYQGGARVTFAVKATPSAFSKALRNMLYLLIGLSMAFAALSAVLAYQNYLPVKRLAQKVGGQRAGETGNEIQAIADAVDDVIRQNTDSVSALTESLENISRLKESLKQQVLLPLTAADGVLRISGQELAPILQAYRQMFQIVRLVDPGICMQVIAADDGHTMEKVERCYSIWDKTQRCRHCVSQEVVRTRRTLNKVEAIGSDLYYILAMCVEVDGFPYSLECVNPIYSDDVLSDENENLLNQLLMRNRQVYTDSLTKVFNRRYCDDRLRRLSGEYALAMIDIDNLKQINDCLGHPAGDTAIYHTAQAIRAILRSQDELVRYGGDEFLLLFHNLPQNILRRKLEDICRAVRALRVADLPELRITVSIGGVYAAGQISELVEKADLALYRAKAQKDSAVLYEEDFHDSE